MHIKGLQKLTLLDYPEKLACLVFTGGCNFRCPFCHNASLVIGDDNDEISEGDFFEYLKKRNGIIEGVCISGGEPTLQHGLDEFIKKIKNLGFLVKLDTNGYRPDVLINLVENKLVDYVAMDIKNSKEKYSMTTGIDNLDISLIENSVDYLLSGKVDYEFRTTVVRELHSHNDFIKIGEWIKGAKRYFLQTFHDSGDLISNGFGSYDENEMKNLVKLLNPFVPSTKIR